MSSMYLVCKLVVIVERFGHTSWELLDRVSIAPGINVGCSVYLGQAQPRIFSLPNGLLTRIASHG